MKKEEENQKEREKRAQEQNIKEKRATDENESSKGKENENKTEENKAKKILNKIFKKEMKKGEVTVLITIGIICAILVCMIFAQFKVVDQTDITSLKNKRDSELKEELKDWQNKYQETENQLSQATESLSEYQNQISNAKNSSEVLDKEVKQSEFLAGKTDVEGAGVEVTLQDGSDKVSAEDLIKLMNELKTAGAEAISVNGQRIINTTEFADVNQYIIVNGKRLTAPFNIKVIGNQKYLESGLTAKGGYADSIQTSGKSVTISENNDIKIEKYDGEVQIKDNLKY